jgi:predicted metal-dependent hydrolase
MTGEPAERDRDAMGRARNARPRDVLGRPLPRTAAAQPALADEAALADEPVLPPAQALATAQELVDAGRPFRAHEVLEASWKGAPTAERDLWRGLAQIAVGLTHAQRGNARGAVALLRRGAERISGYPAPSPHDVDVDGLRQQSGALADRIEAAGVAQLDAADLRIRLRLARPPADVS